MGQRFQLARKLFWNPKVHIHIWRIFFSFQIIPKYVNAAATWKIYIEMFTPTMNSVTPTGETKRCPLTFCSPASDICAAFDIFSNGCGKPFFFLSETKHQITLTNRTLPRPAGLQLGAVVSLNIYVGMVDGGGRRKQEEHIDLRCTLEEKKKRNQPQSGGMRQQAEEADKRRYQPVPGPYLHTESSSRAPWRELLCRGCLRVETTVTTELSPLICAQIFQVSGELWLTQTPPPPVDIFCDECVLTNKCKCMSEASFNRHSGDRAQSNPSLNDTPFHNRCASC